MPRFEIQTVSRHPAACRGCGSLVYWAITASGKRTPLDKPDTIAEGRKLYADNVLSHWGTCPERQQFLPPARRG